MCIDSIDFMKGGICCSIIGYYYVVIDICAWWDGCLSWITMWSRIPRRGGACRWSSEGEGIQRKGAGVAEPSYVNCDFSSLAGMQRKSTAAIVL